MYMWEGQNSWARQGHNGKTGRKQEFLYNKIQEGYP